MNGKEKEWRKGRCASMVVYRVSSRKKPSHVVS